ncbi:hypothetical protein SLE2022_331550 [Rubroshorea leprosula]
MGFWKGGSAAAEAIEDVEQILETKVKPWIGDKKNERGTELTRDESLSQLGRVTKLTRDEFRVFKHSHFIGPH